MTDLALSIAACSILFARASHRKRSDGPASSPRSEPASTNARTLIRQRVDVNTPDVMDRRRCSERPKPLLAAEPCYARIVGVTHFMKRPSAARRGQRLLRAGSQPGRPYGEGETPLTARSGNVDSVKLRRGRTPTSARQKFRGQTADAGGDREPRSSREGVARSGRRPNTLGRIRSETDRRRRRESSTIVLRWNLRIDAGRAAGALRAGTALVAGGRPDAGRTAI